MTVKHCILFFVWFSLCITLNAQQPSYSIIGEEELSGVDIYSINQDSALNMWLATNIGLLKYDGYNFHSHVNKEMIGLSLFGLTQDNFGTLYCFNLSGQLFKIQNDSLHLHYQLPDSTIAPITNINFDNLNQLVISSNGCYVLNNHSELKQLSALKSMGIPKNNLGELLIYNDLTSSVDYFKNNKLSPGLKRLTPKLVVADELLQFNEHELLLKLGAKKLYRAKHKRDKWYKWIDLDIQVIERITVLNDSSLLISDGKSGAYILNEDGQYLFPQVQFSQYKVSNNFHDREGNYWIGTLGKGLIFIPNLRIIDYNNNKLLKEDHIKSISIDSKGVVYLGSEKGSVYKLENHKVKKIIQENYSINFLEYIPKADVLQVGEVAYLASDFYKRQQEFKISAVKDIAIVGSNFLSASNIGLHSVILNPKDSLLANLFQQFHKTNLGRVSSVRIDSLNNEIWVGTNSGLKIITNSNTSPVLFKGKRIASTDLEITNYHVYVATANDGILVYKDKQLVDHITISNGLLSNQVTQIESQGGNLFIATKSGFQIFDLTKKTFSILTKLNGLLSNIIDDFDIYNEHLWMATSKGLQYINLNQLAPSSVKPVLELTNVMVADSIQPINSFGTFKYNENRIEFRFIGKTFKGREALTYYFKLEGLSDAWESASFQNNKVRFSSLPHGRYTFHVKAMNSAGLFSETVLYRFSIAPPFWLTWRFFLLCGLIVVLIVASYFIIRIRIIRKQLILEKQLKASEVTAIKAQMNPHFVFNALNSVQDLILQKDFRTSNLYLGKFADLMRMTLDVSGNDYITLEDEIELFNLYLDLEKLRFGDDFNYTIQNDLTTDELQRYKLPTMLLQPYIENAVKHGLLHKEGQKKLNIVFFKKSSKLICEIIDNGIGRKKSAEIKARRRKQYTSFATTATIKRIDLINEISNLNINLETTDLYNADKIACGTKVVFSFPLID